MVQLTHSTHLQPLAAAPGTPPPSFVLWGLSPGQLHDAFWRSKGVQCVRRGQSQRLQRAAELFLLVEPNQMALFNIAQMSERLTWRDAAVTRIRLVNAGQQHYSEHVITDDRGFVQRIERRYRPAVETSSKVLITSFRRIAAAWMSSQTRKQALNRVRTLVAWSRIDHWKCSGLTFQEGDAKQEQQMMMELIERWPHPDQAIAGLEEIEPGVWHIAGDPIDSTVVRVGPLWLGKGTGAVNLPCLIGPAWLGDDLRDAHEASVDVAIKDIVDVDPPQEPQVIHKPNASRVYPVVKRIIDVAGSLAALIVSLPIMAVVAACILAEDGRPLFFGHTRQGRGGVLFRCWKFRTMIRNAHAIARTFEDRNECDGPQVYIKNDPRVTRVGRILRAAHLDELPQFWNVLVGHMSLVGPRPSPDDENQYCPAWRDLRLSVRPGITGLWQVNRTRGKGKDFQEWIKYDIEYVQKVNVWLDFVILLRTAKVMLRGRSSRASE